MTSMHLDTDACYRAVQGRDRRFDGVFYIGVRTTRIYCRPSCPAMTPRQHNVTFHPTAAAAQLAGYRACKRCLPDATPGSPEWDVRADTAGRAMRLIADGTLEREGVDGLAARMGYSARHLNRLLVETYGAGPLALARSRRAQMARALVETTSLSFADIAFAAGFSSIRQFNDTIREVYASTPSQLRSKRVRSVPGAMSVRLGVREPYDGAAMLRFLTARAVAGVESADQATYTRTLQLPHGAAVVRLRLIDRPEGVVPAELSLADARDLAPALERTRRLLDADADPAAIVGQLGADPHLGPVVRRAPGLRVPGHVDGWEAAVRAVLGQQVTVIGARRLAERFVERRGRDLGLAGEHAVGRLFPRPADLTDISGEAWGMPGSRVRALEALARAVDDGSVILDRSADRDDVRNAILAVPGIGPWTASYIAMRALGDPDVFLPTDAGVRRAAEALGLGSSPAGIERAAASWRPWRSYALMYLWNLDTLEEI
ncbi:MAG: DNA-3-methyladenine glycosylase 2 family protein [Marmoricola sp.]